MALKSGLAGTGKDDPPNQNDQVPVISKLTGTFFYPVFRDKPEFEIHFTWYRLRAMMWSWYSGASSQK
jgi:hypothetical protein